MGCSGRGLLQPVTWRDRRGGALASAGVFLVCAAAFVVMRAYREELAVLDKAVAGYMQYAPGDEVHERPLPYDTGFLHYLNERFSDLWYFPAGFGACLLALLATTVGRKSLSPYLYLVLSYVSYAVLNEALVVTLKALLLRPRPRQTREFHTSETCLVDFRVLFDPYPYENPCDYAMFSTPSGHTNTVSIFTFPLPFLCYYTYHMIQGALESRQPAGSRSAAPQSARAQAAFWVCLLLGLASGAVALFFIPSVMLARAVANAHFATDTVCGLLIAVMTLFVLMATVPDMAAAPCEWKCGRGGARADVDAGESEEAPVLNDNQA